MFGLLDGWVVSCVCLLIINIAKQGRGILGVDISKGIPRNVFEADPRNMPRIVPQNVYLECV